MDELRAAMIEVERELQVRRMVYPRLVLNGKLTQGEADRRMMALRWALYYLEAAAAEGDPLHVPTTTES